MLNIEEKLREYAPDPSAILRYLRGQSCGITDVRSSQLEGLPAITLTYTGDGLKLRDILVKGRYEFLHESEGEIAVLAYKRKLLTIPRGSTFTTPQDYKPRGVVRGQEVVVNGRRESNTYRDHVLEPGKTYAILRLPEPDEEQMPYVLEVDREVWLADVAGNTARANEEGAGKRLSFEEMRWVYRTALMGLD